MKVKSPSHLCSSVSQTLFMERTIYYYHRLRRPYWILHSHISTAVYKYTFLHKFDTKDSLSGSDASLLPSLVLLFPDFPIIIPMQPDTSIPFCATTLGSKAERLHLESASLLRQCYLQLFLTLKMGICCFTQYFSNNFRVV